LSGSQSPERWAQDGGYEVFSDLWLKSVLLEMEFWQYNNGTIDGTSSVVWEQGKCRELFPENFPAAYKFCGP